jgi:hypothetical protein
MDDFDNFINADNSDDEAAFVSTPGGSRHRAGTGSSARKCKIQHHRPVQGSLVSYVIVWVCCLEFDSSFDFAAVVMCCTQMEKV